jgi:PPPDE putative peptidase domain
MAGSSICSYETKSTVENKSAGSREDGSVSVSLPENVKTLLLIEKRATESPRTRSTRGASLSSIDETIQRDLLNPVILAPREDWETAQQQQIQMNNKFREALKNMRDPSMSFDQSTTYDESRGYQDTHRSVASADESEYVRKPQPHKEHTFQSGKFGNSEPEEQLSAVLRKYQYPRKQAWAAEQARQASNLFLRMSRQVRYGRRGSLPTPHRRNRIKLHVYDLIPAETVMQLPWGCMLPIGRCFDVLNSGLHSMGTGAYHVGVEVNGVEYSFGACDQPGHTGVFSCMPKRSPGYQYRTTIDFGERTLLKKTWVREENMLGKEDMTPAYREEERSVDGREVIKEMAAEYPGVSYDLLRKNCVTFACDACLRLGVEEKEIPSYFRNLCESGALTQDVALQTVEPIQSIFSVCEDYGGIAEKTIEDGFEVITKVDGQGLKKVVTVVDAVECNQYQCSDCPSLGGVRRTLSWTY